MSIEHAPERDVPAVRKIISKRQLLETIPLSYPTIWQMMRKGEFPLSIVIGTHGKIGWYESEVADWQTSCELEHVAYHVASPIYVVSGSWQGADDAAELRAG